jgi:hypothetical protein
MTVIIDPVKLAGLQQAAYVMDCLVKQHNEEEIVKMLGGDEQLFDMWKSFLKYNRWIESEMEGWSMTEKGREWNRRLASR